MTVRTRWIDAARGVAMVLVVVGHVVGGGLGGKGWVASAIFLFHMPLFFVLSGLVARPVPAMALALRRFRSLMVPYAAWLVLLQVAVHLSDALAGTDLSPGDVPEAVARSLYGGRALEGVFGAFWFLPCLWLAQVAYAAILGPAGDPRDRRVVAAVAATALVGLAVPVVAGALRPEVADWLTGLPLDLQVVPVAAACIWFGHWLRTAAPPAGRILTVALAVGALAAMLAAGGANFEFDMKRSLYGPPVAGFVLALALSASVLAAIPRAAELPAFAAPAAAIGRASLTIMMLHQLVHFALREAGVASDWLIAAAALVLPLAAHLLLDRIPPARRILLGRTA
jgi:fucose 4-O-acetylase-like acetyltransferase